MVILVVFNSFNVVKNLKKPDLAAHQKPPFYTTHSYFYCIIDSYYNNYTFYFRAQLDISQFEKHYIVDENMLNENEVIAACAKN